MRRIDFMYFDAGGGHRSAATALKTVAEQQGRPWQIRLIQVQDLLRPVDLLHRLTGRDVQFVYNLLLQKGWTLGSPYLVPILHTLLGWTTPSQARLLRDFWRAEPPDMVVSLIPNMNRALARGLRASGSNAPFVTVITDIADYPPHTWVERESEYIICGSDKAVRQAYELGHPPERVFRVSGMILRPHFYSPPQLDRAAERRKLGLDPDLPTALVLFGGHGSDAMLAIAERLQRTRKPVQSIMMCGHNAELAARLKASAGKAPMHVQGFTSDVPYFMQLADFLIGKPGPGSISEALAMQLPVIIERNAYTLPQERYNADWVLERRVGLVLRSFRHIASAVDELLDSGRLAEYRANAAAIENRAVFEIPDLLERIFAERSSGMP